VQTAGEAGLSYCLETTFQKALFKSGLTERDAERGRAEAAERRLEEERLRAAAEAAELRTAGEAARIQAAEAKATAEGLRAALEEARRPFWRRWIG
jgi:flagellar biosynthesis/type III secretory pathway protein FliH